MIIRWDRLDKTGKQDRIHTLLQIIEDTERMRSSMADEDKNVISLAMRRKQAEDDAKDDAKGDFDFGAMKELNDTRRAKQEQDRKRANEMVKRDYRLKGKNKK